MTMFFSAVAIAWREIRRNVLRSSLTILGVVIGVAAVIAMVTFGRGTTARVTEDIARLGNNMLIVRAGSMRRGALSVAAAPLTLDDARAIEEQIPAVAEVAPMSSGASPVVYANRNVSTSVSGITNEWFAVRGWGTSAGRIFTQAELSGAAPVCILGQTVRKKLFGSQDPLGAPVRVQRMSCTVIGVLTAKGESTFGQDQDDLVVMPLRAFQRRIAGNNDLSTIFVSIAEGRPAQAAVGQIQGLMRERRRVGNGEEDDFSVQDMQEIARTLGSVTGALTALLGGVAAVSLLVGGIGIMNVMLVSVTERTREIGLRLAVGARGRDVLLQFLVEAVLLSTLGGIIGIGLGVGGSAAAVRALNMPFVLVPDIVIVAFAFSALVGIVFGFFPARKAARLQPIEALRHE